MNKLLLIGLAISLLSCSKQTEEKTEFEAELKFKKVIFYSDKITFEPPRTVTLIPNSAEIRIIDLDNRNQLGVKYMLSEQTTGADKQLTHNVVFSEKIGATWNEINSEEHREKATLDEEKEWGIGVSSNDAVFLKTDFSYKLTKI